METVLIWFGSGFAFAAGVVVGAFLFRTAGKEQTEVERKVNDLLQERNRIGHEQVLAMSEIADAIRGKA